VANTNYTMIVQGIDDAINGKNTWHQTRHALQTSTYAITFCYEVTYSPGGFEAAFGTSRNFCVVPDFQGSVFHYGSKCKWRIMTMQTRSLRDCNRYRTTEEYSSTKRI
jgi:hypothetical protein